MKEVSINIFGQSTMCRLCLSSSVTVLDLFSFSNSLKDRIADVIMKCAPIQIRRRDGMPNFICQKCYTRLENTRQFQVQIIKSEKTLHLYLEQLHCFDKKPKLENFIQKSSDDSSIDHTKAEIPLKYESLDFKDVFDVNVNSSEKSFENFNAASKINDPTSLKHEIRDQQIDDISLNPAECTDHTVGTLSNGDEETCNIDDSKLVEDMDINKNVEDPANFNSPFKSIEEITLKSEIKDEPLDGSTIQTKLFDGSEKGFFQGVSEISCKDTKDVFDNTSGNSTYLRSTVLEDYFEKIDEGIKNTSVDREKHNKASTVKSHPFKIKNTHFSRGSKKSYPETGFLKTHEGSRISKKPYRCDVCKKFFTQSSSLNTHKLIHTGEKPYKCDMCNRCFTQSSHLKTHKLIHTGERPYQCDLSKKCFTMLCNLETSKPLHTDEKTYQCDVCNKFFTQASSLNTHKLIHTGEKPYQCDVCNKCFTQSSHLKVHKLLHTGEKPYQCDVCSKCFTTLGNLKTHKRLHTGEKPYQCDVCKKCFTALSNLNTHSLTHTSEKPY